MVQYDISRSVLEVEVAAEGAGSSNDTNDTITRVFFSCYSDTIILDQRHYFLFFYLIHLLCHLRGL